MLVLDDATSAIDVRIEAEIHDALRNLLEGRTTIVIAHRLSTIALADRVVLLEGGSVAASGTHAELMATEPRYAEVLARSDVEASDEEAAATDREEDDLAFRRRIALSVMKPPDGGGMGGPPMGGFG
jgi:ABC-type glutathione transport system ATPase component